MKFRAEEFRPTVSKLKSRLALTAEGFGHYLMLYRRAFADYKERSYAPTTNTTTFGTE